MRRKPENVLLLGLTQLQLIWATELCILLLLSVQACDSRESSWNNVPVVDVVIFLVSLISSIALWIVVCRLERKYRMLPNLTKIEVICRILLGASMSVFTIFGIYLASLIVPRSATFPLGLLTFSMAVILSVFVLLKVKASAKKKFKFARSNKEVKPMKKSTVIIYSMAFFGTTFLFLVPILYLLNIPAIIAIIWIIVLLIGLSGVCYLCAKKENVWCLDALLVVLTILFLVLLNVLFFIGLWGCNYNG